METNAIDTVELVRRHRILKGSSLKEAYEAVKNGWDENAPAAQIASLLSVNKQLLEALENQEGDLVLLRRAIEENDPKHEVLFRTNAMLDCIRAALLAAKASS